MSILLRDLDDAARRGRTALRSWSKTPTQTTASGIWFDLSMSPGNPVAQYYFATPLTATALARSTDGGFDHGANVGDGFRKILARFDIHTATGTAAPMAFEVLDYLAYYPGIDMDVGVKTLSTPITIPRYAARDGVQMMLIEQNAYVGGAQFAVTFLDENGVTRTTPTLTCNTQVSTGTIVTSGPTQAGACGRFLPLGGAAGVSRPLSIEFFTPDVGLLALVLVAPIWGATLYEVNTMNSYDLFRDMSDLPVIKDDAYLNVICQPVGTLANAPLYGNIGTLWSAA